MSDVPARRGDPALNATGDISPQGQLLNLYKVIRRNQLGFVEVDMYEASNPSGVLFQYDPTSFKPYGSSKLSKPVIRLINEASRLLKRISISAEFNSMRQKYVIGLDNGADVDVSNWAKSPVLAIFGEGTDKVKAGEFSQTDLSQMIGDLNNIAKLFMAETNLSPDKINLEAVNNYGADTFRILNDKQREEIQDWQELLEPALRLLFERALKLRDGKDYDLSDYPIQWQPTEQFSRNEQIDQMLKLKQAYPEMTTEEVLALVGFNG
jgi:hypothetical protein